MKASIVSGASLTCVSMLFASDQAFAALPDITVTQYRMTPSFEWRTFLPDSCAIDEKCVNAPGARRLLEFDAHTPNIGAGDLLLGDPRGNPLFEYSPCHNHYHFKGYAKFELLDPVQQVVMTGRKQAFCVGDAEPMPGTTTPPVYNCDFMGISVGWSDIYGAGLECQWLDVTDIPPGSYVLRVTVNPDRVFAESNYDNNVASVPVIISDLSNDAGVPDGGVDAGTDAGSDGGIDSGVDAGTDAGSDGGVDGGLDAGTDAGSDSGVDGGLDAGTDAGSDSGIDGGSVGAGDAFTFQVPAGGNGGCSCDAASSALTLWCALLLVLVRIAGRGKSSHRGSISGAPW